MKLADLAKAAGRILTKAGASRIWLAAAVAFVCILLMAWITRRILPGWEGPLLVASMGASSVLLFAVPASPMSRPWPLVGGHLSASLVGVSCALYIPDQALAAALAVSGALLAMHFLRCLHPPGGAAALVAVVGSDTIHELGYRFVLTPVMLDVAIMLLVALLLKQLLRGRARVAAQPPPAAEEEALLRAPGARASFSVPFSERDLDAALRDLNTYLDIDREDLLRIYDWARLHARMRTLGGRRVADVMDENPCRVEFATPLEELWRLLRARQRRGAAVVSRAGHVLGIVTVSDFVRHAENLPQGALGERLRQLMTPTTTLESDKPEVAGQIMSRPVITACSDQRLAELVPVFINRNIHHLPVVDARDRLVGMIAWEDVLALTEKGPAPQPV